jgi:hypothetical protein
VCVLLLNHAQAVLISDDLTWRMIWSACFFLLALGL